ncbi:unnamed protein product, partial [Dracunculus medinensis]|uniref:Transmembrane protein 33 n=1 Tax=Dracunculus medinensis TaxID=318479 RepID=A0A0N4UF34_DRAME
IFAFFKDFIKSRSTESILCLLRVVTVVCAIYYILPIGSRSAQTAAYSKVFIAAAATNALRAHQRVGAIQFSREFLGRILVEDSCHYLLYSLFFLTVSPVTMALVPVFLYALLNACSFIVQLFNAIGNGSNAAIRKIAELTNANTQNMLNVIACSEILVMPILVVMIFAGKASIFHPFVYYRFLTLRYLSRRNASTRMAFYHLRVFLEKTVSSPSCPQIIRLIVHNLIAFTCRLCPTVN